LTPSEIRAGVFIKIAAKRAGMAQPPVAATLFVLPENW
jgi:hypothetical protein